MSAFLAELGKKLAERWITLLLVPGLLYVSTVAVAAQLGHSHAWDFGLLQLWISDQAKSAGTDKAGVILMALAAVLAASAGAGLIAAVLGRCVDAAWSLPGRHPPLCWVRAWRSRRWQDANNQVGIAIDATARAPAPTTASAGTRSYPDLESVLRTRNKISLCPPTHPSWIGDRLGSTDTRVHQTYGLDLTSAWPRLWLVVPEVVRTELSAAHDSYTSAARLTGWAILYAVLAVWWWPASLIAAATGITAHIRARAAAAALGDLTEAAVDLYGGTLATALGIGHSGQLTRETGQAITRQLRKDELHLPVAPEPQSLAQRHRETA